MAPRLGLNLNFPLLHCVTSAFLVHQAPFSPSCSILFPQEQDRTEISPPCSAPPLLGPFLPSSSSPWLLLMLCNIPVQYPGLLSPLDFSQSFRMISQFIQIILKANSDLTMLAGLSQLRAVHKFNKHTLCQGQHGKCGIETEAQNPA